MREAAGEAARALPKMAQSGNPVENAFFFGGNDGGEAGSRLTTCVPPQIVSLWIVRFGPSPSIIGRKLCS